MSKRQEDVKKKSIHEGHRARLVNLAKDAGLDNMSVYQVMEFFLTYIFPRGDTNPLAHRLLDEFESFTHVIDADPVDLMRIEGINERSAKMITMFNELFYYYATAKMHKKFVVKNRADLVDVVEDYLRFRNTENMILLALSPANIITHKRRIKSDSSAQVGLPILELTNFLATAKPASLVIAHCHPYGKAVPSQGDKDSFKVVSDLCRTCGIELLDSYIVGEDGVYSQAENRLARTYYDIEELKENLTSTIG